RHDDAESQRRAAITHFTRVAEVLQTPDARWSVGVEHGLLARLLETGERWKESLDHRLIALAMFQAVAEETGDVARWRSVAVANAEASDALAQIGRSAEALSHLQSALALAERLGDGDTDFATACRAVIATLDSKLEDGEKRRGPGDAES
ncbi:MAG: hypothetical protein RLZZ461_754, partial [Planctomycetota bacterium]